MKKIYSKNFYNSTFVRAFSYEPQSLFRGSRNDDYIIGTEFADKIKGRHGNDTIFGDDGNDVLYGGRGNDFIDGGNGNDRIKGGKGVDEITGGDGADVFHFKKRDSGKQINGDDLDVVTDYNYNDGDVIQARFKFDTLTLENGVLTFSRKEKEVNSIIISNSPQTVKVNGIDVVDSGGGGGGGGSDATITKFNAIQDQASRDAIEVTLSGDDLADLFTWSLYNAQDQTTFAGTETLTITDPNVPGAPYGVIYFDKAAYGFDSINGGSGETVSSFVLTGTLITDPSVQIMGTVMFNYFYGT